MKSSAVYVCKECGYESPKWFGRCPSCGALNSAVELKSPKTKTKRGKAPLLYLNSTSDLQKLEKIKTGLKLLDEALGGGFIKGQAILLGGEPGIGKSTLALQICEKLSKDSQKTLYATAEESHEQIVLRSQRLGINENVAVISTQDIDEVIDIAAKFDFIVIDSIQTFTSQEVDSFAGSISQVRQIAEKLVRFSKDKKKTILMIGHITKSGEIAGPKAIEHMVDTVLYFEGERTSDKRILRVYKNRFGPSGELILFEMNSKGLKIVENLTFFDSEPSFGNVISCAIEGSKPLIIQVQALVSRSKIPTIRRNAIGVDIARINALVAVIGKYLKLPLDLHEIYVKILGGLRIFDPGIDLAISAAIISSFLEKEYGTAMFGEVGLDGKVRKPYLFNKRVSALKKAGFDTIACPSPKDSCNIEIKHLKDLIEILG